MWIATSHLRTYLACIVLALGAHSSLANQLVAHWRFHEAVPSFADHSPMDSWLLHDLDTTAPLLGAGILGSAASLRFEIDPGVSTRLFSPAPALQRDQFGFSFWIRPVQLNPGDNLIAKEMSFDNTVPNYARMAWQLSVLSDSGSGWAPVELIVRGDDRGEGDFFGAVVSGAVLPLQTNAVDWVHIAGGYDAQTGALTLYVNGVKTVSANSSPGATLSDGGPLTLGSVRNGSDFVAFAGTAFIDDIQIYGAPLADADVAWLRTQPGRVLAQDLYVTEFLIDPGGDEYAVHFDATSDSLYTVEVSADLQSFTSAVSVPGGIRLWHDGNTAGAWVVPGVEGDASRLRWESGSTATRLFTDAGALQTDSFGFSFWMRPINLNPFDNIMAKEMAYDGTAPAFARMAWQVHLLENTGSDTAHLQLIVRGANRANGDFFGTAISVQSIPLFADARRWIHVAGGYNTHTGALRLFVDGVESVSGNSLPGAYCSDGSPLSIGSALNGPDYVAFAGATYLDDVRIYKEPPTTDDVVRIAAYPGQPFDDSPHLTAQWLLNGPVSGWLDTGPAIHRSRVGLSNASLNDVLGLTPLSTRFFRVVRTPISTPLTPYE